MEEKPKLQVFYEGLIKDNYKVPDYATFEQTLKDPAKSKVFYDGLVSENYKLPEFETFVTDLGLKKKDASDYGLPTKQVFADMFSTVSKEKPEVSERPADPIDPEKYKVPAPDMKEPQFSYPGGPFANLFAQSMKRNIDEETFKQHAQERIGEIDKKLEAYPKAKMQVGDVAFGSDTPPQTKEEVEKQGLLEEKESLKQLLTAPTKLQYVLGKAYKQSIVGLTNQILTGYDVAPQEWLSKYDASTMTDVAATALGFLVDSPAFSAFGAPGKALGDKVAKPLVRNLMNKGVEKFVKAGVSQEIAEKLVLQGATKLAYTIPGALSSGTALGGYGSTIQALSDWADPEKDFKDIDWGMVLSRGMKDFSLGVGVGTLGLGTAAVAKKAQAIPSTAGRIATQAGVQAGGLTAESALFVGGGALLEGRKLKDITKDEFLETVALLGTLKLSHAVQKPGETIKNIRKSVSFDSGKPGEGQFEVDIKPWEIESLAFAERENYESAMKSLSKDDAKLAEILTNEQIPAFLKAKILWGARGIAMDKAGFTVDKVETEGEYVNLYNKEGVLVDKRKYDSTAEADQGAIELGLQLEDNKMQARSAEPDVDKVKIITDLKNEGTDIPKLLEAVDKPVEERTPEESKQVGNYYSKIPKPKKEKKTEESTEEPLTLGGKTFADKTELFKHLEEVAFDKETKGIKEGWMDTKEMPNTPTLKAINEWEATKKKSPKNTFTTETPGARVKRTKGTMFKEGSRTYKALNETANDFTDAVMQYFISGGKISKEDFIAHSGWGEADIRKSGLGFLLSKGGKRMDVFNEAVANSFGMENKGAMDMTNEIIDILKSNPTRGKMLSAFEKRRNMEQPFEPTEEEIAMQEKDEKFAEIVKRNGGLNVPAMEELSKAGLISKDELETFKTELENENTEREQTEREWADEEARIESEGGIEEVSPSEKTGGGKERAREIEKIAKDEGYTFEVDADLDPDMSTLNVYDSEKRLVDIEKLPKGIKDLADEYTKLIHENNVSTDEKPIDRSNPPDSKGEENIVPGSTEGVSEPVEAEGRKKPVRTADVAKQRQIDVIDKDYDAQVAEQEAIIPKAEEDMRKALLEADTRNGLFGDTRPIEKDEIISREEQGFTYNEETRSAIRKPFEEKIAEANKKIASLNKERESKIGEVLKQQTLGFEEPAKPEPLKETKTEAYKQADKLLETSKTGSKLADMHDLINHQIDIGELKSLLEHPYIKKYKELTQDVWSKIQHIQRHPDLYEAQKTPPEPKIEGIKFKDKNYTDIEQVQDDLAEGKITFDESKTLMEDVRKFEDKERTQAKKTSDDIENLINKSADDVEKQIQDEINDVKSDLHAKIYPEIISKGTTSLYKQLKPIQVKLSDFIASGLIKGVKSQNDIIRWTTKTITNLYDGLLRTDADIHGRVYYKEGDIFNQKIVPERKIGKLEMLGTAKSYAKYKGLNLLNEWHAIVNNDPVAWERTWNVLDPELANFQTTEGVLKGAEKEKPLQYGDLSLSEKNLFWTLKKWNTWLWSTNYANELVSTESYLKFKGDFDATGYSDYIARMYDAYEESPLQTPEIQEFIKSGNSAVVTKRMITDYMKFRGEVNEWKAVHAIKDPAYLTAKRVMQTIQNVAIKKYMELVIAEHPEFVKTIKEGEPVPKGYTHLSNSYSWGPFRGKAVINHIVEDFTGFHYSNALMNTAYDMIKIVDRTGLNQFYKKFRTVLNPFVQTGNVAGNFFLASINGLNPIEFAKEELVARNTHKKNPALFETLLREGLIGDVAMTGEMKPGQTLMEEKNIYTKVSDWASERYVGADNVAKIAAYKIYRKHGLNHKEAVRRAYDAFQNYATVGKTWDFASKIPAIGPTFVKFQADLQRIMANSLLTTPLTTVGTFMLIKLAGNLASALSGESDEEQEIRESRKGVPRIPFLDIPLSFKVGNTEVNVARYLTPLFIYPQGDSEMDIYDLSKFMPIQLQKPKSGSKIPLPAFADATWGFLGSIATDRDFCNVSIQDPYRTQYTDPNIGDWERFTNVMRFTARSQVPFYRSTEDLINGMTGQLDYYGRKRDWKQAIFNNIIKVQEFGDTELRSYMERNIDYLTNRFAALSENMGDANTVFMREIKRAEDLELSDEAMAKLYEREDKKRSQRMQKSLDEQVPVMAELERITGVYKKWFPDNQFIQENFVNIEAGKNRRFNVENNVDLQKKYPYEYKLLKNYNILKPPREVPTHINEKQLTEEQRKQYVNIYWREYLQYLDNQIGLTEEEFNKMEEKVLREEKNGTGGLPKKITMMDKISERAYEYAKYRADSDIRFVITVNNK